MKRATSRRGRTGPEYRVRVSFGVPLDFAFAWCTDYTPEDASLEGETYQRKIIERTSRRVIFEDLEESDDGWNWSRDVVTLRPPNRWHMIGIGNRRDVRADYVLSPLPDGRTRFDLRWRRRPKVRNARPPRCVCGSGSPPQWNRTTGARDDARPDETFGPEPGAPSPMRCRCPAGHAAVIVPKSPSASPSGPAVKNSVSIGPLFTVPCPNCSAQSPSMTSLRPSAVRSAPMSSNVPSGSSWYAFTWPSPKLPTSRSPPNRPKLAGASARPHGAFSWPCCATRTSRFPSVSKASTKPRPWPSISSFAPGPCFANVTKIRAPIVWIPNGA